MNSSKAVMYSSLAHGMYQTLDDTLVSKVLAGSNDIFNGIPVLQPALLNYHKTWHISLIRSD